MKKEINCHDCSNIVHVLDEFDELEIKYCPLCGSENIEDIEGN